MTDLARVYLVFEEDLICVRADTIVSFEAINSGRQVHGRPFADDPPTSGTRIHTNEPKGSFFVKKEFADVLELITTATRGTSV